MQLGVETALIASAVERERRVIAAFCTRELGLHAIGSADAFFPASALADASVVVVDEDLVDGLLSRFCANVRAAKGNAPILVLGGAAPRSKSPAVDAIHAGADQYLQPPRALDAIRAALLSWLRYSPLVVRPLRIGTLRIDVSTSIATLAGTKLQLQPAQFRMLVELAKHHPRPVPAHRLLQVVLSGHGDPKRNLKPHACALRKALGRKYTGMVRTVRGFGYALQRLES